MWIYRVFLNCCLQKRWRAFSWLFWSAWSTCWTQIGPTWCIWKKSICLNFTIIDTRKVSEMLAEREMIHKDTNHRASSLGYDPKIQLECVKTTKYCNENKALFMRCEKKNVTSADYLDYFDISSWSCSSVFGESRSALKLEVYGMRISCETLQKINHTSLLVYLQPMPEVDKKREEYTLVLKDSCSMRYSLRRLTSDFDRYMATKALAYCIFFFVFLTVCCIIAYKTRNIDEARAGQQEPNQMPVFCIANSSSRNSNTRARNGSEDSASKTDDLPPSYSVLFDNVTSDVAINVAGHASSSQHRQSDGQWSSFSFHQYSRQLNITVFYFLSLFAPSRSSARLSARLSARFLYRLSVRVTLKEWERL